MNSTHEIEVFYDGDCPLCRREIAFLRRRDSDNRICFTDIAASEFDAGRYGRDHAEFMARIQARLSDGSFIDGVEVFRRLYAAVGYGWLVAPTRLPGIAQIVDQTYSWFARHRLRLTGRCDAESCSPYNAPTAASPQQDNAA